VVSRAVGTAVERNRLKRQIRVAWRELRPRTAPVDCVVVVRKPAVGAAFSELAGHLEGCLQSLGVLGVLGVRTADAPLPAGAGGVSA
jgi:ribonuclease P protein component